MSCDFRPDTTIVNNYTFSTFSESFDLHEKCMSTYLRPDPGGALIPWLYALFLLLFHLPACIIRAVRWESAQYLALGLAVLGIALTIQAYEGTKLTAETVLVWMPLTLILDVGAMLQMVVLILEEHDLADLAGEIGDFGKVVWKRLKEGGKRKAKESEKKPEDETAPEKETGKEMAMATTEVGPKAALLPTVTTAPLDIERAQTAPSSTPVSQTPRKPAQTAPSTKSNLHRHAFVALTATTLLLVLLTLQLFGLAYAIVGHNKPRSSIKVNWCSPAFRDFAIAVIIPGMCTIYPVVGSSSNGIGCISIDAEQQTNWLTGTIVCLVASLVFQGIDVLLLRCAHGMRWRGVKMQRPWLTMFGGVLILVILIAFGVFNAGRLPAGIPNLVWIFHKSDGVGRGRVCEGILNSPGLRGMIIGWTDGIFDSWGSVYHGNILG